MLTARPVEWWVKRKVPARGEVSCRRTPPLVISLVSVTTRPYPLEITEAVGNLSADIIGGELAYWPEPPPPVIVPVTYLEELGSTAVVTGQMPNVLRSMSLTAEQLQSTAIVTGEMADILQSVSLAAEQLQSIAAVTGGMTLNAVTISLEDSLASTAQVTGSMANV